MVLPQADSQVGNYLLNGAPPPNHRQI